MVLFSLSFFSQFHQEPENNLIPIQDTEIIIKGTILDKVTNEPVPRANIVVAATKTYIQANDNGAFTLSLKPEYATGKVRVLSLGYTSQEFNVVDLIKQHKATKEVKLFLTPDYKNLKVVEVKAKARKWKIKRVGYHIGEGSSFHRELYPSDTLIVAAAGQEIGNRIQLNKYPAFLQSVSFGLAGSGGEELNIRVRLYSLKDNLPYLNLLPESAIVAVPPYHTGWVTVNLQQYNIKLQEDFAVVIEWQNKNNELNTSSLMAFASVPKGQITYYRESDLKPWKTVNSTLVDIKSIGMYVTLLYER